MRFNQNPNSAAASRITMIMARIIGCYQAAQIPPCLRHPRALVLQPTTLGPLRPAAACLYVNTMEIDYPRGGIEVL